MPSFRCVKGEDAGPGALGILVPPGQRSVLILRPRALEWDLLLVRPDADSAFWAVRPSQAEALMREVHFALEEWSAGGSGTVAAVPAGTGFGIHVEIGSLGFVVCRREPGKPYQPLFVKERGQVEELSAKLLSALRPSPDAERELYFNTRNFSS